ncbi:surface-adhesin E family protein [Moraxella bovoculi]|uniref:surface-adhesin E family protein n=1 Tax=Moraxella bovoculi TaxID=386891 RepID=UPI00062470A4|nr:surface-adhesin E family protein [Moraxella bovoculi]AKG17520.1 hypothetical protein AAX10_07595 [Moraxella bovoculi]
MKKLFVVLGIGLCLQQAHATNWVQTVITDEFIIYIDNDSIKTNRFTNGGTYVSVWSKLQYHHEQESSFGRGRYTHMLSLLNFDCQKQKRSMSYIAVYNQDKPIRSFNTEISVQSSSTWNHIIPDTPDYIHLNHVCSLAKK